MKFTFAPNLDRRESTDLLVLPFWEGGKEAADFNSLKSAYTQGVSTQDFHGKSGETMLLYTTDQKEPRILLLGLGKEEKLKTEALRRAFANAMKVCRSKKKKSISIVFPKVKSMERNRILEAVSEGILLTNYAFDKLRNETLKERGAVLVDAIHWIGVEKGDEPFFARQQKISEGVYFIRDLVNSNADEITPKMLADTAKGFEKISKKVKTTVYDKAWMEKEKMGLLLAVNRGSTLDPYFIQVEYQGDPASKEKVVLVGKGITYDSGGLNLKPGDGMLAMKCDMTGSAVVLGTIRTAALLDLKVNVTVLVPSTENSIGPDSYKPGDVYRSYSGKTVEITNTDAEGRLALADALSFAVKNLKPTAMIDLATLTGAIVIALGEELAGMFSNNDQMVKELLESSKRTDEQVWNMPLHKDYLENYKSDIADIVNSGGRDGSSIKAALFLSEFVGEIPWTHFDIAGTAYWNKPKHYHTTKATGFGLRLLLDFLEKKFS